MPPEAGALITRQDHLEPLTSVAPSIQMLKISGELGASLKTVQEPLNGSVSTCATVVQQWCELWAGLHTESLLWLLPLEK